MCTMNTIVHYDYCIGASSCYFQEMITNISKKAGYDEPLLENMWLIFEALFAMVSTNPPIASLPHEYCVNIANIITYSDVNFQENHKTV